MGIQNDRRRSRVTSEPCQNDNRLAPMNRIINIKRQIEGFCLTFQKCDAGLYKSKQIIINIIFIGTDSTDTYHSLDLDVQSEFEDILEIS